MQRFLSQFFRSNTPTRMVYVLIVMILMAGTGGSYVPLSKPHIPQVDNSIVTDTWAVQVLPGTDPDLLARQLGAENLGPVGALTDMYLFRVSGSDANTKLAANIFSAAKQVVWFEQQIARQQSKRAFTPPTDPLYSSQWHLNNTAGGVDINVLPAWTDGSTGSGVTIAVVDNGLQYTHPDLSAQYVPAASYDFNGSDSDPMPDPVNGDFHGTAAAGIAAANNDGTKCGVGVAYDAGLAGLRLTAGPTTDAMEASALNYAMATNFIYSNSWGPLDNAATLQAPGPLTLAALQNGVNNGRGGKGSIYVWAAGNGGIYDPHTGASVGDNVNYDGYANSRFAIAVGAVDDTGVRSNYTEPGAALLVTAPSSGGEGSLRPGVTTTDLLGTDGFNTTSGAVGDCVTDFGSAANSTLRGTSSSASIVSGVVALMLQANPNLGWRDVQHILAKTAVETGGEPYAINGAGLHVNHKYGFGLVDAGAAVAMAKTWTNVGTEAVVSSGTIAVNQLIPDNDAVGGITSNFVVNQNIKLEHVEVVLNVTHTYRGDLKIVLTAPSGIQSILADVHGNDLGDDYTAWKFMTVRNWDESSNGTWSLKITDPRGGDYGTFTSWQLNLYGTVPAGTNDNIEVSEIITSIPYQSMQDTLTATTAPSDLTVPACGLNQGSNSVWFSYTPTTAKPIYFDTYGSSYDTFIAVWSGSPGALSPVTCNNDSASTLQSAVGFTPTPLTTYYIEVAQYSGPLLAAVSSLSSGGILRFHGTSFSDVRGNYWAWNYVEGLFNAGITSGCSAGSYCPSNPVTRAQMAIFLVRAVHGPGFLPPEASGIFPDVPVGSFGADYIEQLFNDGITSGCGDGNYCPGSPVTRAQMAIFLLRGKYTSSYTPPPATGTRFTDVTIGSFGAAFIEQLAAEGITSGCTATMYCPNVSVNRAQMAVFIDRAFSFPILP
ncbi:MAG: S8 family serine peptidase [Chloroflexi bacterium]|nr:S8 family serine peptidase [Chloroflexota bacterium]